MKKLCLDCFIKGRVKVLVNGQCPACGCRQSVVQPTTDYPEYGIWPWPAQHRGTEAPVQPEPPAEGI